jgi:glycosyltransferase involved in cell wall biosynthesis
VMAADVVSLYWINGAFVSPEGLSGLTQPIVWRLSDVWPFTGCCHYPGGCPRFEQQCGHCPQVRCPSANDASHRLWQRKKTAWQNLDMTVVAPSRWMASLAKRSSLFSDRHVEVIPTGVDLDRFRPINKLEARAKFGIPADKKVVAFGAVNPQGDARKGFSELRLALEMLAASPAASNVLAIVFGSDDPLPTLPVQALSLGRLRDDDSLSAAYSAADVVVVPSLEDNLPNVALEAIACGTPVAGFDIGGMPDIVLQGRSGRLAPSRDAAALGRMLSELLVNDALLNQMRNDARRHAMEHFSLTGQARTYLNLYDELSKNRRNTRIS